MKTINISDPKFKVGEKIKVKTLNEDGKEVKVSGVIKSNNTIDYMLLNAVYDIEFKDETDKSFICYNINEIFLTKK